MSETRDTMIKRLRMRSMRRGIKEMDLILTAYADGHLDGFSDDALALYDQLLSENDHDLYGWIGGQFPVPMEYLDLVTDIAAGAQGVTKPA
ncbi:MAG: succinate dehydrogenase assembly factor 2 [Yoonia sp.]|uniref:succinate dehydrogenase assembly factor 2 n=1 Tax=Yoonia sp. TaxID=2212373 RepID=UPI003EF0DACA